MGCWLDSSGQRTNATLTWFMWPNPTRFDPTMERPQQGLHRTLAISLAIASAGATVCVALKYGFDRSPIHPVALHVVQLVVALHRNISLERSGAAGVRGGRRYESGRAAHLLETCRDAMQLFQLHRCQRRYELARASSPRFRSSGSARHPVAVTGPTGNLSRSVALVIE